jgi:Spy/CpxP family protein refolding chaperone
MQLIFRLFLTLGAAVWIVGLAGAQIVIPGQANDFSQIQLLQNQSVQKELNLTEEQVQKLRELFVQNQENLKEVWQKYPPDEAGTQWQELSKDLKKGSLAVLDDRQKNRFWQIDFQYTTSFGWDSTTYARPDISKRIGITDEQKKKLQDIQADTVKKNQEAIKTPNLYQQKVTAARKEDREQVEALLTEEQKKKWQEVIGDRFVVVNNQVDLQAALRKWIRDDFGAAQAQARKTGKPIFLIFRCEP